MKIFNEKNSIDASELFTNTKLLEDLKLSGIFNRDYYSSSSLKAWEMCPAKFIIETIEEQKESPALLIGSLVHSLLEDHYKEGKTKEETINSCSSELLKDIDPFHVAKAKEYLNSYFEIKPYKENLTNLSYIVESVFEEQVSPLGVDLPVKLKGMSDRVDVSDEGIYVIDYKTASKKPSEDQYIEQMIIYKWLLEKAWGVEIDDIYIASLFIEDPKYIKQEITLRKQSELIDKIFSIDEEVQKSIKDRKYKKKEGYWCRFCSFKDKCRNPSILEYE